MDGADVVRAGQVTAEQLQERPQPLGSPGGKGNDDGQFRDLAQPVPTRPALCTGGGAADASEASLLSTFSSALRPTSGASANSSRNWLIFSAAVISVAGGVSVVICVMSFRSGRGEPAAQNEQWCAAEKSVWTAEAAGTSDSTFAP